MMEQEAVVARVEGEYAYLEVAGDGCAGCHEPGGCQGGVLASLFRSAPRRFRILNGIGAAPGERVVVRVPDGAVAHAVLLTYVLPLLSLLLGAIAGAAAAEGGNGDLSTAIGALCGLVVGVLPGLTLRKAGSGRIAQPQLVRRLSVHPINKEACR